MASGPGVESRSLGGLERVLWLFGMNLTFAGEVEGPLDPPTLRIALDAVQRRHPLLRASLERGRGAPSFRIAPASSPGPPIPLSVVDDPGGSWTDHAERELDRRFIAGEAPLARATLLRNGGGGSGTILVTVSHALADARATGFLFRDLLEAAAQVHATGRADLPEKPVPPTIEEVLVRPLRAVEKLRAALQIGRTSGAPKGVRPARLPAATTTTATTSAANAVFPSTRVLAHTLEPEGTAALVARAREEKTTVHGALVAAQLLAIAAECSPSGGGVLLYLACPVNVAARVPSPVTDDVVLFASGVDAAPWVTPGEPLWQLARKVRRQLLETGDPRDRLLPSVLSTGLVASLAPLFSGEAGKERLLGMARKGPQITLVTNAGALDLPSAFGPFRPLSFSFLVDNPAAPVMSTVATVGGRMSWCFETQRAEVDDSRAGRIAQTAWGLVRGALGG